MARPATRRRAVDARRVARRHLASPSTRARSSASPASRATARPNSIDALDRHADRRRRRHHASTATTSPTGPPAGAARAASATSPRTATGTACSWRPRSGRTASSAMSPRRPTPRASARPQGRPRATPSGSSSEYDVRTPGIDVTAASLSGGNQQKLIVGREMSHSPKLLIAAHPTRGVDVGAQAQIWDQIREARREGLAVLLISADLDELIGLSDTLRVMYRGRLVADADPATDHPRGAGLGHDRRRHRPPRSTHEHRLGATEDGADERPMKIRQGAAAPRPRRPGARARRRLRAHLARAARLGQEPVRAVPTHVRQAPFTDSPGLTSSTRPIDVLPGRPRRRHRLPDEPVQHRRRRPVPPRGVASPPSSAAHVDLPGPLQIPLIDRSSPWASAPSGRASPVS